MPSPLPLTLIFHVKMAKKTNKQKKQQPEIKKQTLLAIWKQ